MFKSKIKKGLSFLLIFVMLMSSNPVFAIGEQNNVEQVVAEDNKETITENYEYNSEENYDIHKNEVEENLENTNLEEFEELKNAKLETRQADNRAANIIDTKEKLINLINKDTITNEEYIIKGRIELSSDELPATKLNVKGSKIIGEDAEIIINTGTKLPRGIFGTIQNHEVGSTGSIKEVGYSYISDIKFTFNGDVEKYTFAENLEGNVYEDVASTINNIDITVNGNILPDENEQWKNISGFVINCYGFDLNGIKVHVTGNIGKDKKYSDLIGVQGLFTDALETDNSGWSPEIIYQPPTRVNDCHVKVDGSLIAKADWALAGGLTVNDNPVIAKNVSSDIGSIEVESTGTASYHYSGASIGFLNNHDKDIVNENAYVSLNIPINPWVNNDINVELRSLNTRASKNVPDNIGPKFDSPMTDMYARDEVDSPRVDGGTFTTESISVNSATKAKVAGAAYYMAGADNTVNIKGGIDASGTKESVIAGYGGYNKDGENINVNIGDIDFNLSNSSYFGVFGSTVNDVGTKNSKVTLGNINGKNTSPSGVSYIYVGGWSNASTLGESNTVNIENINVDGVGNNYISGYARNIIEYGKNNDKVTPKIEHCKVVLGDVTAGNGNGLNSFTGFANKVTGGEVSHSKIYANNITLKGGNDTKPMLSFGGFVGNNNSTIENSAVLIGGDINLNRGLWITTFGGFAVTNNEIINNSSTQIAGSIKIEGVNNTKEGKDYLQIGGFVGNTKGALENNTVLIFGSIENPAPTELDRIQQSLGLFGAYADGATIKNNAVYIGDEGNVANSVLKDETKFIGNPAGTINIDGNTILLDKDANINVNNLVPETSGITPNNNYFVEVDGGLRTAYPYAGNKLDRTDNSKLGNIIIAGRTFQEDYWEPSVQPEQNYSDFKYVIENKANIPLDSYGPDIDISAFPFEKGNLVNFYDRHMAIIGNGITYDIFGIRGADIQYSIIYDGNGADGGTVPIDSFEYEENAEVIVLDNIGNLKQNGYTFKGWNTSADGNGTSYKAGDTFKITANTTLYAQWEKDSVDSGTGWTWGGNSSTTSKEKPKTEEILTHIAYLNGYPDNTIRPQGSITRAEVAAIFARLKVGEANIPSAKANYSDVNASDWYTKYIAFVTDNKIMEGYEDGSFKPNDKITRAEFTVVVARYNSLADMTSTFEDVIGHWAAGYIGSVTNKGWINGYPDGTFKPEKDISREEVATMVNKMLDRKVDKDGLNNLSIKNFKDLDNSSWSYFDIVEASNSHKSVRRTLGDIMENWKELIK